VLKRVIRLNAAKRPASLVFLDASKRAVNISTNGIVQEYISANAVNIGDWPNCILNF
jgi:hypothetical protein